MQDNLENSRAIKRDALGRPVQFTDANGGKTQLSYDSVGNLVSLVDPLGHEIKMSYNAARELTATTDPAGNRVEAEYDDAGRVTSLKRPGGGNLRYEYDALGNPIKITLPDDESITNTYDNYGRLLTRTDAKGQTTRLTYDELGRLSRKELADGTQVRYEYDKQGRLTLVDDGTFPVRKNYDERGNLSEIEYPAIKRKLRYEYDDENQLSKFNDSEGRVLTYGYDQEHRLSEIREGDKTTRFTYDKAGRRSSVVYPNGIRGLWKYDAQGRLVGLAYLNDAFEPITGWKYAYDTAGNLVETTDTFENNINYAYDAAGQLVKTTSANSSIRYEYAPRGNRVSRKAGEEETRSVYNDSDQLLKTGETTYEYDANGNLVFRNDEQGATRFHYDAQDQLVKVELPDGETVEYGYSPTGERIWRRDSEGIVHYVTDGINVLAELNEDLTQRFAFTHAPGIDRPIEMSRADQRHYLLADHLGSIRSVVDKQGKAVASIDYDAFGTITKQTGNVESSFTYTGRELDPKTGLYYYRARYYDSQNGRFLTRDPLDGSPLNPLSMNEYLYTDNNPLGATDPMGTNPWSEIPGAAGRTALNNYKSYLSYLADRFDNVSYSVQSALKDRAARGEGSLLWGGAEGRMRFQNQIVALEEIRDELQSALSKAPPGAVPNNLPAGRAGLQELMRQGKEIAQAEHQAAQRALRAARDARAAAERARVQNPMNRTLPAGAGTNPASRGSSIARRTTIAAESSSRIARQSTIASSRIARQTTIAAESSSRLARQTTVAMQQGSKFSSLLPKTLSSLSRLRRSISGGMGRLMRLGGRGLSAGWGLFAKVSPYLLAAHIVTSAEPVRAFLREAFVLATGKLAGLFAAKVTGLLGLSVASLALPVPVLAALGIGAAIGGYSLLGWAFDSLWPPGKAQTAETKPPPKISDDGFIPQTIDPDEYTTEAQYRKRAQEIGALMQGSSGQGRNAEIQRRAKAAAAANNSTLEDYRQRADFIHRQKLAEEERRRQAEFDARNRAIEAERHRRMQQMRQWQQQQQRIPHQQQTPWRYRPYKYDPPPKNIQV